MIQFFRRLHPQSLRILPLARVTADMVDMRTLVIQHLTAAMTAA